MRPGLIVVLIASGPPMVKSASFFSMFQALHVTRDDVVMTVFPMYGRVGFAWVACSVMFGIRNVLTNFEPARTLELTAGEGVTMSQVVNGVPWSLHGLTPQQRQDQVRTWPVAFRLLLGLLGGRFDRRERLAFRYA